jgi:hypothetical protein
MGNLLARLLPLRSSAGRDGKLLDFRSSQAAAALWVFFDLKASVSSRDERNHGAGYLLDRRGKKTTESKTLANARKPSAATENLCCFLPLQRINGGLF